ncbi:non-ribosomal peptide synthetase [Embleya scabrispora]|uniref:non-ribosomal peptide synthetase n=1 Tax=Embleya scabrispora TaxID=159449 RepID=UPI0003A01BDF|nr:non-ribosomal peptide synthetase [Embleya scabrispora]MYS81163.1 amino acid adenylation domain-containing protein [Streptomyces sp. SID5474]
MPVPDRESETSITCAEPAIVSLPDSVAMVARRSPDLTAVFDADGETSFAALDAAADRWAAAVADRVSPGGWVAVCGRRGSALVAAALGCLRAGRVYVPLDPAHPGERIALTMSDARPELVLVDRHAPAAVVDAAPALRLDADPPGGTACAVRLFRADPAYVIYTSGSTGTPKGVVATHGGLATLVRALSARGPALTEGDVVLSVASIAFDMSVTDVFVPLAAGASVVLPADDRTRDPDVLLDLIDRHRVSTVLATPSLWRMLVLAGLGTDGRHRVRAFGGGEKLTERLARELLERTVSLHNGYGPTETTVYATFAPISDPTRLPLGDAIPGTRLYVLDGDGELLPPGPRGELYVGGLQVSGGYHRRPALTAEKFVPDPFSGVLGARMYRTGDVVRLSADGDLHFLGRTDDQVKIRGHRVEPGEVVAVLEKLPSVRQAAVLVHGDALAACLVAEPGHAPSVADVRAHARLFLPEPMVPDRLSFLPALPMTGNGKVDHAALLAWQESGTPGEGGEGARNGGGADDGGAPEGSTETAVAKVWGEVLGLGEVDVRTSFFDLGGHSLLAMEVVSRLRTEYELELPVWELFAEPTVRAWAAVVDRAAASPVTAGEAADRRVALSPEQRALCHAERLVPGITSPGLTVRARLTGAVDTGGVAEALTAVLRGQECLRTRFEPVAEYGSQLISPYVEFDLFEADLRGTAAAGAAGLDEAMDAPFDLAQGPLLRAALRQFEDERFELEIRVHDAVADAASLAVIVSQFADAYAGDVAAEPVEGRFTVLAQARREASSGVALADAVTAFRASLAGTVPVPEGGYDTGLVPVRLDATAVRALSDLAPARGVSMEYALTRALLRVLPREWGSSVVVGRIEPGRSADTRDLVAPLSTLTLSTLHRTDDREDADGIAPADSVSAVGPTGRTTDGSPIPAQALLDAGVRSGAPELRRALPWLVLTLRKSLPAPREIASGVWLEPVSPDPGSVAAQGAQRTALPVSVDLWADGDDVVGLLQHRVDLLDADAAGELVRRFAETVGHEQSTVT